MGLARAVAPGQVIGVDIDDRFFEDARKDMSEVGLSNIEFQAGDIYDLEFDEGSFEAAFMHSVLEALTEPLDALRNVRRVLKKDGLIGVASVDYGGVIIGGEDRPTLEEFYRLREMLWIRLGVGNPRTGRNLRGMLHAAGFSDVTASSNYITQGDSESVRSFANDRVREIEGEEFVRNVTNSRLADAADLENMKAGWDRWGDSDSSYFAFSWCNAVGYNR